MYFSGGYFRVNQPHVNDGKLYFHNGTLINISFSFIEINCTVRDNMTIDTSRRVGKQNHFLPQCKIVKKGKICRDSRAFHNVSCGCLHAQGTYYFTKLVDLSDNSLWRWEVSPHQSEVLDITFVISGTLTLISSFEC